MFKKIRLSSRNAFGVCAGIGLLVAASLSVGSTAAAGVPVAAPATYEPHVSASSAYNTLFIIADDLRDWIGTDRPAWIQTPHLDALMADSVYFSQAQTSATQCNPMRTSLWTGLKPSSTGVLNNSAADLENNTTVANATWRGYFADPTSVAHQNYGPGIENITTLFDHFADHGYYIGGAGKLFHQNAQAAADQVWDQYYPNDQIQEYYRVTNRPLSPLASDDYGAVEALWIADESRFAIEADLADAKTTTNTISMLRDVNASGEQFFIGTGFWRPHGPHYVPQRFVDLYNPSPGVYTFGDHSTAINQLPGDLLDVPSTLNETRLANNQFVWDNPEVWNDLIAHYAASISFIDEKLGDIVAELHALDMYDTTNIVFTSDHGYALGEKQHIRKATLWQETTSIPLSIRIPGVTTPGQVNDNYVNTVDLFPTLVEIAGLEMPTDFQRDGRSFTRLLVDNDASWPWLGETQMSTTGPFHDAVIGSQAMALRSKRDDLAYIEHALNEDADPRYGEHLPDPAFRAELYDTTADPHEWENLLHPARIEATGEAYEDIVDHYSAMIHAGWGPQRSPQAIGATVELGPDGQSAITLVGEDDNLDYLEFYVGSLPTLGTLHTIAADGSIGDELGIGALIPNEPGQTAELVYLAENRRVAVDETFSFTVSDGNSTDTAQLSIVTTEPVCDGYLVTIDLNLIGTTAIGTPGDDVILGTDDSDTIYGSAGDDRICGGGGGDTIYGGVGSDRVFGGPGGDLMYGSTGNDFLDGGTGNDTIYGQGGLDTLYGRDGNDRLFGLGANDFAYGGTGNDRIEGGRGVDRLWGGPGLDQINGGAHGDFLFGEGTRDILRGGGGADFIDGGEGNDDLFGDENNDELIGGLGRDRFDGGDGSDLCHGDSTERATNCE